MTDTLDIHEANARMEQYLNIRD